MSATQPRHFELRVSKHALDQWDDRSPMPALNPRLAWKEGTAVDYPSIKPPAVHARYHEETDLILLAAPNGTLLTVIPLGHRPQTEQQHIRSQVSP